MYNGNLVTCLSIKSSLPDTTPAEKEQYKLTMQQMVEKNLEIASSHHGEDSIHLLYQISSTLTNKIALGSITTATDANPLIKRMRAIITKFHGGDPAKVSNQLFFQQQLLYAQMLEATSI